MRHPPLDELDGEDAFIAGIDQDGYEDEDDCPDCAAMDDEEVDWD